MNSDDPDNLLESISIYGTKKKSVPEKLQFRRRFLAEAHGLENFMAILEDLPDLHYFLKSRDSCYLDASPSVLTVIQGNEQTIEDFIGTTDFDYFPSAFATQYIEDDRWVIEAGKTLHNKLEYLPQPAFEFDWHITTKSPIFDHSGSVIGIAGTSRKCANGLRDPLISMSQSMLRALIFLQENPHREVSNEEIARIAYLSARQLTRQFLQTIGMSPRSLNHIIRMTSACRRLLESADPIIEIAMDHGWQDQSTFTASFRRFTGTTPRRFREYWKSKSNKSGSPPDR